MDALDKRVIQLLDTFEACQSLDLETFRLAWKRERFAQVHILVDYFYYELGQARTDIDPTKRCLVEHLFIILQRILVVPGVQLPHKVGAIYCLWATYHTQELVPPVRIPMAPNSLRAAFDVCSKVHEQHKGGKQSGK